MRKGCSIFLLILANLAVVVHAVVPHHHHSRLFTRIVGILDDNTKSLLTHTHPCWARHHGLEVLEEYYSGVNTAIFVNAERRMADCRAGNPVFCTECNAAWALPYENGAVLMQYSEPVYNCLPVISSVLRAPPVHSI